MKTKKLNESLKNRQYGKDIMKFTTQNFIKKSIILLAVELKNKTFIFSVIKSIFNKKKRRGGGVCFVFLRPDLQTVCKNL